VAASIAATGGSFIVVRDLLRALKPGRTAAVCVAIIVAWIVADLSWPYRSNLRDFDPVEVAKLETAMWRSYYDRKPRQLFWLLAELLQNQYELPLVRSNLAAHHASRAAFVFKLGRTRDDYEKALPSLRRYYGLIRRVSTTPFDVDRAARGELEWWIIHRERAQHDPEDLVRALAELQATLFGLPTDRFLEHGARRAEAMTLRDDRAAAGGVSEDDWDTIDELLQASYGALHRAVQRSNTTSALQIPPSLASASP
jgi:hypothetical protein